MNSFILAGGELQKRGLALVHGLKTESMNGMIVVTERLAVDGELYKGAIVSIGSAVAWRCSGTNLQAKIDGVLTPSGAFAHALFLAKNLIPIKPEAEPKLITVEREVTA